MKRNKKAKSRLVVLCLSFSALLATSFVSTDVFANHIVSARHINTIQTKQAKSIVTRVSLGRLTLREARKLRQEQYEITVVERDMREDGTLNASELSKLFKRLQSAQNNINKLLRNNISTHARNIASQISTQ